MLVGPAAQTVLTATLAMMRHKCEMWNLFTNRKCSSLKLSPPGMYSHLVEFTGNQVLWRYTPPICVATHLQSVQLQLLCLFLQEEGEFGSSPWGIGWEEPIKGHILPLTTGVTLNLSLLNPGERVEGRKRRKCQQHKGTVLFSVVFTPTCHCVLPENAEREPSFSSSWKSKYLFLLMQLREEGIGPGYNLCLLLGTSCALGKLDNCWTAETFPMPCIRTQNIIKFLKMPRLCYINLQFPLKNCMGARVFFCSPFLLTTNTPNHTQELHGHSKTSPRPQFSAICKLGPFWLAQTNLISRKELTGAVLSLWRISLGPENEPGTDA